MDSSAFTRKRRRRHSSHLVRPGFSDPGRVTYPALMTPPDPDSGDAMSAAMETATPSIDTALNVISTEATALANLRQVYATDKLARSSMEHAVEQIAMTIRAGGKLVLCGVGKSGLVAKKAVATMNSVGVESAFLHPTEAVHGDLGMVRQNDTVLFITFSGKTSELMFLLPHLPSTVAIIAVTSHRDPSTCPLLSGASRRNHAAILLPAPIHEAEETSFGLPAPMASTTVALAVCDALALATTQKLYTQPGRGPADIFREFHPGGAIGATFASASTTPVSDRSFTTRSPNNQAAKTSSLDRSECDNSPQPCNIDIHGGS